MAYLKQIEGVTAPVRVDNKPSYGSYVKTSATDNREVYKDGEWYESSGGELVTNGTFDTDVSGVSGVGDGQATWELGSLKLDASGLNNTWAYMTFTTEVGTQYIIEWDFRLGTSTINRLYAIGEANGSYDTSYGSGTCLSGFNTTTFTANTTSTSLYMFATVSGSHFYDNISVFKSSPTLSTLPLPPQSYIEDSNGKLVEFEVIDGQVVDTHTAGYVPAIVENKVVAHSYGWANDGIDYVDEDAIGSNPVAKIYPDGTIVGSTSNGSYTKYPNGDLVCRNSRNSPQSVAEYRFDFDYPVIFVGSFPTVSASGRNNGTSGRGYEIGVTANLYRYKGTVFVKSPDAYAGNTINAMYTAKGRWKA